MNLIKNHYTKANYIIIGIILFLESFCSAFGQTLWTQRNPLPTSEDILKVAYGNGKYIGIVGSCGIVLASSDGINWTKQNAKQNISAITWGSGHAIGQSGLFVMGRSGLNYQVQDTDLILVSSDGNNWNQSTLPEKVRGINDIIWDNTQFVALVASKWLNDTMFIFTSPDALTWTKKATIGTWLQNIYFVGNKYLMLESQNCLVSSDCITWKESSMNLTLGCNLVSATWDGHKIIAIADSAPSTKIITSLDGMSWISSSVIAGFQGSSITWNGSLYIIAGTDTMNNGAILSSSDGINWTKRLVEITKTLGTTQWIESQYICVGNMGYILTSPDGINWADRSEGSRMDFSSILFSNNQYYVTSTGQKTTIFSSSDGILWKDSSSSDYLFTKIAGNGSKPYVAIANSMDTSSNTQISTVITSVNAKSWSKCLTLNSWIKLHGLTWGGNQYIIVGDSIDRYNKNNGIVYTSPDGMTWKERATGTPDNLRAITWTDSQYIAVGDNGTILSSSDGVSWSDRSPVITDDFEGVAGKNNNIVVLGRRYICSSIDGGNTWIKQQWGCANDIVFNGETFVIVGCGGYIETSKDGTTWTIQNSGTSKDILSIAFGQNQFVTVGSNGTILTSPSVSSEINRKSSFTKISPVLTFSNTVIRYSVTCSGSATIYLFDIRGRLSRTLINGFQAIGEHSIALPRDLAQGRYIVSYRAGDTKVDKAIMIMH
jgi:hypothetical protein